MRLKTPRRQANRDRVFYSWRECWSTRRRPTAAVTAPKHRVLPAHRNRKYTALDAAVAKLQIRVFGVVDQRLAVSQRVGDALTLGTPEEHLRRLPFHIGADVVQDKLRSGSAHPPAIFGVSCAVSILAVLPRKLAHNRTEHRRPDHGPYLCGFGQSGHDDDYCARQRISRLEGILSP
jgi:hypothetical protein